MEEKVLKIDNFEGPLDLLLHLIDKKKVKITDIKISQLIDEYLSVIAEAQEENIDIKADFLVVASELLEIKAAAVLDSTIKEEKESELKKRLEDYKVFKELSQRLGEMENEYNVSYSRGEGRKIMRKMAKEYDLGEIRPFDIFKVYAERIEEQKEDVMDLFLEREYSLNEEAEKLYFGLGKEPVSYGTIFEKAENLMHLIYLFLSILELYKEGYLKIDDKCIKTTSKRWSSLHPEEDEEKEENEEKGPDQENINSDQIKDKKRKKSIKKNKDDQEIKKKEIKEKEIKEKKAKSAKDKTDKNKSKDTKSKKKPAKIKK